jgi:hypothetical protein
MRILHLTHHPGCEISFEYIAHQLGHEVNTDYTHRWPGHGGVSLVNQYNITHEIAKQIWDEKREYFKSFDLIVTSDTAPLSRIFLQNNYTGRLLIWVCNRFDYWYGGGQPDKEYYDLIRSAPTRANTKIFGYTLFENIYARTYRNVEIGKGVLKPVCPILNSVEPNDEFFVPPYHNDTIFMNLQHKCSELGISAVSRRYNGLTDLQHFKGIIHIPYAWSTLALFEGWAAGIPYLIPSKDFLLRLSNTGGFWWCDSCGLPSYIENSEWYTPEHRQLFLYFDSWDQLRNLAMDKQALNYCRKNRQQMYPNYEKIMLALWKTALEDSWS